MTEYEIVLTCEWGDVTEVKRLLPRVKNPAAVRSDINWDQYHSPPLLLLKWLAGRDQEVGGAVPL